VVGWCIEQVMSLVVLQHDHAILQGGINLFLSLIGNVSGPWSGEDLLRLLALLPGRLRQNFRLVYDDVRFPSLVPPQ